MNEVLERALHTFWQAFISTALTLACTQIGGVTDIESAKVAAASILCGALAAAFSAIKTMAVSGGDDDGE